MKLEILETQEPLVLLDHEDLMDRLVQEDPLVLLEKLDQVGLEDNLGLVDNKASEEIRVILVWLVP